MLNGKEICATLYSQQYWINYVDLHNLITVNVPHNTSKQISTDFLHGISMKYLIFREKDHGRHGTHVPLKLKKKKSTKNIGNFQFRSTNHYIYAHSTRTIRVLYIVIQKTLPTLNQVNVEKSKFPKRPCILRPSSLKI